MATNLDLDPDLVERALALSGAPTKKAAVTAALQEYVARREQRGILELFGKLEWDPGHDYKHERSRGSMAPATSRRSCRASPPSPS